MGKIFWNIIVSGIVGVITGVTANHIYWVLANQNKLYYTISHDDERTRFTLTLSNKTNKDIEQLKIILAFKDKLESAQIFSDVSLKPTEVEFAKPNTFSHIFDLVPKDTNVKIYIDSQAQGNSIETKPIIEGKYSIVAEVAYKIWTVERLITIIVAIFSFVVIALIFIIIVVIRELRRSRRALEKRGAHSRKTQKQ